MKKFRNGRVLLFLLLLPALASAHPIVDACFFSYGQIAWTEEAILRYVQELSDTERLTKAYLDGSTVSAAEWKKVNDGRGSRAFREAGKNQNDYGAEMHFRKQFLEAMRNVKASPKNVYAHEALAYLVSYFLERTGVPVEVRRVGRTSEYAVTVKPLTDEEWTAWNRQSHGGVGNGTPSLVKLARHLGRRKLALEFHTGDVAGVDDSGGHFQRDSHISLGFESLFDLHLTSTLLHEKIHADRYEGRDRPWGTWSSFEDEVLKPYFGNRGGKDPFPSGPIDRRELRPALPFMEVEATRGVTDNSLEGTLYEKRFMFEELEAVWREALQHAATAKRLKAFAEREGPDRVPFHAAEMEMARDHAKKALDRLRWVARFSGGVNYSLYDASTTGSPPMFSTVEKFKLRKSAKAPFDMEIVYDDGKIVRFLSSQFPDLPKQAEGRDEKEKQTVYLKLVFERVRQTALAIQFNGGDLSILLRKEFQISD